MSQYQGKVAVITGSSRGIGKAIAIKLAQEGMSIVLNGRNQERLDETKAIIEKITPNVITYRCDVSDAKESENLINAAVEKFGKLDVLVNNVGVSNRGTVEESSPDVFKRVFESNVLGSVNPTIPALPHIKKNKGSLVFISSLAGIRGLPNLGAYCSSKMALRAIAESIRIEEYESKIHVGLIYVGITEIVHKKESISADGTPIILEDRTDKKVQSVEYVAKKVFQNIRKRKFITTLSAVGKLNAFLQPRLPGLVEKIIIKASKKFEERSK
jgi:NAD(P)-dependent dehydrogenase (short-subunit alcohol dehydrogenase family)